MNTRKQQYFFDLIEQWHDSAMVKKDFCSLHNIKLATFQYWISKYKKANQKNIGGFVPLHTEDSGHTEITYPNGVRISIIGSDPASIAQLIHLW
jgi:hypothetical protein